MPIRLNLPISADGTLKASKQQLDLGRAAFKRIDNGTESMAVNGLPAGSTEIIWNGTSDPGGDWVVSGDGSESSSAAYSGSTGWDSGPRSANNFTDFDYGSLIDIGNAYSTLSFWLQVKNYPNNGTLQLQWRNDLGTVIGATILVENYISNMDPDIWQHVSIPISDFGLSSNVQKLRVVYKTGNNQQHWIDNIELAAPGGGGPFTYRISSPTGLIYHVEKLILVVSAPDVGWTSSAFANLSDGLDNGVLFKYHNINTLNTFWTFNSKNNTELFGQFESFNSVNFDNSEQLIAFSLKPELSSVILVDDDDVLDIIIRDDLSNLTNIRAFLHYGTEVLPT